MIELRDDYSQRPEGFRDARESYSGNSSPIIVGPCAAGHGTNLYKLYWPIR